ncbi:hypothetical protein LAJ19_15130 (plasmid) [Deinococcus taeanensis]|uniref:hypothetical protein n=1 Tax=Deinococcus taeanensis TaxID=2737050 RepID=UPI001CDC2777|nr:hypothetical protein [Deinococcus taeanensis]UBV44139.1 hypothetical protein LAJ19_15130 [Deinococcus taeanensis]
MRSEFDPMMNGSLDKLSRYRQEAATQAALREAAHGQASESPRWWRAAVTKLRRLFHLPVFPAARH